MKSFERSNRIRQQLWRYIADVLRRNVKGYDLSAVTVTDVGLSRDYKYATVYYTILGDETVRARTAEILDRVRLVVQAEAGGQLGIRVVPKLQFEFDNSVERGMRLGDLFSQIESERKDGSTDN
ncbi:30S ribosome-binding factor RbfA [Candidatus Zixiibacteriota bacterium]